MVHRFIHIINSKEISWSIPENIHNSNHDVYAYILSAKIDISLCRIFYYQFYYEQAYDCTLDGAEGNLVQLRLGGQAVADLG